MPDLTPGNVDAGDSAPRVTISDEALAAIYDEIDAGGTRLETGGILLGHTRPAHIHVAVAGGPGPNARRTPDTFSRDRGHAEELARDAWQTYQAHWVGDWHTHPGTPAIPSPIDLVAYLQHLADPDLGFETFISVIAAVGSVDSPVLACWVIRPTFAVSVPLEISERID